MYARATASASSSSRSSAASSAWSSSLPVISPRALAIQPVLEGAASDQQKAKENEKEQQEAKERHAHEHAHLSPLFQKFMSGVIVLSAIRLGVQCQWSDDKYPSLAQGYFVTDITFLLLFVGEIVIKMSVLKHRFFRSRWNCLDFLITVASVCDTISQVLPGENRNILLQRLSMLRFLRIVRLIRVLKGIDELVVVVEGLIKAMSAVAWVFCLLLIVMYMFGVFLTMELAHDEDMEFTNGVDYFGDLGHSMLTLLDIALLAEWAQIMRPIMHHRPMLLPLFLFFMMISTFGVMNILIGVIVDSTAEARMEMEVNKNKENLKHASLLWEDALHKQGLANKDLEKHKREGTADMNDLLQQRKAAIDQVVQVVLDSGHIDFPKGLTPEDVVNLLDFDGNNDLCHEEFKSGLGRLLMGNEFQMTCLMLTMMGKMRKETRALVEGVQEALEHDKDQMETSMKKIEDKIWLKLQVRNAQRGSLEG